MARVPIRSPRLSLAAILLGLTLAGAAQAAWSHDPITAGVAFAPNQSPSTYRPMHPSPMATAACSSRSCNGMAPATTSPSST